MYNYCFCVSYRAAYVTVCVRVSFMIINVCLCFLQRCIRFLWWTTDEAARRGGKLAGIWCGRSRLPVYEKISLLITSALYWLLACIMCLFTTFCLKIIHCWNILACVWHFVLRWLLNDHIYIYISARPVKIWSEWDIHSPCYCLAKYTYQIAVSEKDSIQS